MAQLELRRQLLERDALLAQIAEAKAATEAARERSDRLLRNILPSSVTDELTAQGGIQPRSHESATILFADFKDFTRLTEALDPASLVEQLNHNFARFDEIVASARLEPLKTVGDAYLCAGGLPEPNRTHAIDAGLAALQMQRFVTHTNRQRQQLRLAPWQLRSASRPVPWSPAWSGPGASPATSGATRRTSHSGWRRAASRVAST